MQLPTSTNEPLKPGEGRVQIRSEELLREYTLGFHHLIRLLATCCAEMTEVVAYFS